MTWDQVSMVTQSCLTLCDPMDCSMLGFPVYHQLPEVTQIHVHRVSDVIQPSHPLSSPSPPAFNLSQPQGLFHLSVLCIRWPKYWSFNFIISPSNEHSGLISFRIDWLDLLAVQGVLRSLIQHHSSKAWILLKPYILKISKLKFRQLRGTRAIFKPTLTSSLYTTLEYPASPPSTTYSHNPEMDSSQSVSWYSCHCFSLPYFEEGSGPRVLLKSGPGNRGRSACTQDNVYCLWYWMQISF